MRPVFIYDLSDPRTGHLRYVGKSVDPSKRLAEHLRSARKGVHQYVYKWIGGLLKDGLCPVMTILEEVSEQEANEAERSWIASMRLAGCVLTNQTDGGDGQSAGYRPTKAAIEKQVASTKARGGWSDAHRAAHAAAMARPETGAKMSASRKGRKPAPETIEKISTKLKGHTISEESRKRLAELATGKKWTQEQREKFVAKMKGRPGRSGWKHTEEAKERIGSASKERKSAAIALAARWEQQ